MAPIDFFEDEDSFGHLQCQFSVIGEQEYAAAQGQEPGSSGAPFARKQIESRVRYPVNLLRLSLVLMIMPDDQEERLKELGNFIYTFLMNLNEVGDIRFLSIIMHQYLDYHTNGIISSSFKNPEEILKKPVVFGFYQKCILLKAIGIFDKDDGKKLMKNIRIINEIRNFYAHNLLDLSSNETIPQNIKDKINSMHRFNGIAFKEGDSDLFKFKELCLSTIAELSRIPSKFGNDKKEE